MDDIKKFLMNISHHPGVYQMVGESGEILYVGKAKDLKKRVSSYFNKQSKDPKTTSLVKQIKNIDITITANENEAVLLECNLIKTLKPRYNILLRDDKSFPYILITNQHSFPRIDIYRGPRKKNGLYFGPYPNSLAVRESINLIQKLFRLRTCRDNYFEARSRPCLLYQIGRCTGPCVKLVTEDAYQQQVQSAVFFLEGKSHELISSLERKMETASIALDFESAANYRDQISRFRQMQDKQYISMAQGDADAIGYAMEANIVCLQRVSIRNGQILGSRSYFPVAPVNASIEEIINAFLTQHYLSDQSHVESIPEEILISEHVTEKALLEKVFSEVSHRKVSITKPVQGKKMQWLKIASTSAKQSLALHLFQKLALQERLIALQKECNLPKVPRRIECFDISHSMGEAIVGSCVVFDTTGPVKNDYRQYNISGITPGDDIAAMRQVLLRRFKRLQKEHAILPDIILIDGGKTQLEAAKQVIEELTISDVSLIGISKGPDRKPGFETLHYIGRTPMHLSADSKALHVLQQIRDEAHRFAISGHRAKRDKTRRQSALEKIPGIGAKRRRELLRYFGGIQGIAHASLDELRKVSGISRPLAERIFAAFHDKIL